MTKTASERTEYVDVNLSMQKNGNLLLDAFHKIPSFAKSLATDTPKNKKKKL